MPRPPRVLRLQASNIMPGSKSYSLQTLLHQIMSPLKSVNIPGKCGCDLATFLVESGCGLECRVGMELRGMEVGIRVLWES